MPDRTRARERAAAIEEAWRFPAEALLTRAAEAPLAEVSQLFTRNATGAPALRLLTSADAPDEGSLDGNQDEGR